MPVNEPNAIAPRLIRLYGGAMRIGSEFHPAILTQLENQGIAPGDLISDPAVLYRVGTSRDIGEYLIHKKHFHDFVEDDDVRWLFMVMILKMP